MTSNNMRHQQITLCLQSLVGRTVNVLKQAGVKRDDSLTPVAIEWMEPYSDSGSTAQQKTIHKLSIEHLQSAIQLHHDKLKEPYDRLHTAASEFLAQDAKFIRYFGGVVKERPAEDLLLVYFAQFQKIDIDEVLIENVARRFVYDLSDDLAEVRTVSQITYFDAEQPFELTPEIKFRPMSEEDVDEFGRVNRWHPMFGRFPIIDKRNWICEHRRKLPKDDPKQFSDHAHDITKIISALQLAVQDRASFQRLISGVSSPFLGGATYGQEQRSVSTSPVGQEVKLSRDLIATFQSRFQQVERIFDSGVKSYLKLPMRRMRQAAVRFENEDCLVDYVLALERLLACDTPALETTYRFRLRGAALLPESFASALERTRLMSKLYKMRSDIVHGRSSESDVKEMLPIARDALREILCWYIDRNNESIQPDEILREVDIAMIEKAGILEGHH